MRITRIFKGQLLLESGEKVRMKSLNVLQQAIICQHQLVQSNLPEDQYYNFYRCIRCHQAFKVEVVESSLMK